jgi:hypothetical protein
MSNKSVGGVYITAYKGYTVSSFTSSSCTDGCDVRCTRERTFFYAELDGGRTLYADTLRGVKSKVSRSARA